MAQSTSQAIWSRNNFLRNLKQIWMDTQIKEKHYYYFCSLRHWSVRAMLCTYFATLVLVGLLFSPEKQDSWAVVGSLSSLKSFQIEIPHARCPLAFISNLARVMLPTSTWWVMSASDFASVDVDSVDWVDLSQVSLHSELTLHSSGVTFAASVSLRPTSILNAECPRHCWALRCLDIT